MKKLSELMLEGYSMVGKQCFHQYYDGDNPRNPEAVCGEGASYFAECGNAVYASPDTERGLRKFEKRVGLRVSDLNDEGMSIPDIAGIAAAEGL